jgi:hypothetical protein
MHTHTRARSLTSARARVPRWLPLSCTQSKGRKAAMEDRHVVAALHPDRGVVPCARARAAGQVPSSAAAASVAAVFDGHAGDATAAYAAQHIPRLLHAALSGQHSTSTDLSGALVRGVARVSGGGAPCSAVELRCGRELHTATDVCCCRRCSAGCAVLCGAVRCAGCPAAGPNIFNHQLLPPRSAFAAAFERFDRWWADARCDPAFTPHGWDDSGSTAVVALVSGQSLVVANAGARARAGGRGAHARAAAWLAQARVGAARSVLGTWRARTAHTHPPRHTTHGTWRHTCPIQARTHARAPSPPPPLPQATALRCSRAAAPRSA